MRLSTWEFYLRETGRSLMRNRLMSLASISTVALSLLILGLFLLGAVNLNHIASTLENQVEVTAYLDDKLSPAANKELTEQVRKLPGVREATFVSKEEALERLKEQFGERRDLLAAVEKNNPLRNAVEVRTLTPQDVKPVVEELKKLPGVAKVSFKEEIIERLFALTRAIRYVGLGIAVLLIGGTVFLISNTIRLTVFARRREIGIMKLVGATDWFIRWPFLLEGICLGLIGSLPAVILVGRFYRWLAANVYSTLPFIPLLSPAQVLGRLSLLLVGLGILVGGLGSAISVRRFLRV
ncbi:MAG: cell division transport system permease protein [Bacillota bacterium]|nr:cell division transport system permease protein [Bacillota bacterium]MDK2925982.1 cell division transport system permease protein [Bacillota bacterium]MDK2960360.1 cell division transport system permease protein [Bacillota bacterium]